MRKLLVLIFIGFALKGNAQAYVGQNVNVFLDVPLSFQTILDLEIDSVFFYEEREGYKADEKYFRINREQYKIFVSNKDKLLVRGDNKANPLLYAYAKNAQRTLIEMGYHNVDVDMNNRFALDTIVDYDERLYLTIDTTMGYAKYNRYYYKMYSDQKGKTHYLLDKKVTVNKRPKDDMYRRDTVIKHFKYFISGGKKDTASVEFEDKIKPFLRSKIDKHHKKKLYFIRVNFDGEEYGFEKYLYKLIKKNCKIYEHQSFLNERDQNELPQYLKCYDPELMKVVEDEVDMYFSIFNKNKDITNFENYLIVDHDYNVIYTFSDRTSSDAVYEDLVELFGKY